MIAGSTRSTGALALFALGAAAFAALTVSHFWFYLRLPADILGFWEGNYVADLIKLRAGVPLYTAPEDNSSSVYTPGAQLLSYGIASLLGRGTSIATLRAIQFGYVVTAALFAADAARHLARRFLPAGMLSRPALWMAAWWALLVLVATEDRFNQNVHTLHPDGLTLLVSAAGFWLLARYHAEPARWLVVLMALVPAVGFWSKQSLLIWGPIFVAYLWLSGPGGRRRAVECAVLGIVFAGLSFALLRWVGGPYTSFWVFGVLGGKDVSLLRSGWNLFAAGGYAALALAGLWLLLPGHRGREVLVLFVPMALLFALEAYTSGIGWQMNHLGPGVLIATAWFLAGLPRAFAALGHGGGPAAAALQASLAAAVLLLFAGFGLVREPRNPVSADVYRYIHDIEREFEGTDRTRVLLDRGSWVYLGDTVLMKDRASSVALHVGKNQAEVNRAMLEATIGRIEARAYDKILVRDLDSGSSYDFQLRGSGVRDAMLRHYVEHRRIPAATGVNRWWPLRLLADVSVLVPRTDAAAALP